MKDISICWQSFEFENSKRILVYYKKCLIATSKSFSTKKECYHEFIKTLIQRDYKETIDDIDCNLIKEES